MTDFWGFIFPTSLMILMICAIFIIGMILLWESKGIFRVFGASFVLFDLVLLIFVFNVAISR